MAVEFGSDSDALAAVFPSTTAGGERKVNSDLLAAALAAPYQSLGVLSDRLDEFRVEHSSGMRVVVGTGVAIVGTTDNPVPVINDGGPDGSIDEALTIPDGSSTERIDLVSLRVQFGTVNKASIVRTAGTPGSGAAPATPTQTDDDYHLPLATITVPADATTITDANIANLASRFASIRSVTVSEVGTANQLFATRAVIAASPTAIASNSRWGQANATRKYLLSGGSAQEWELRGEGWSATGTTYSFASGGVMIAAWSGDDLYLIVVNLNTATPTASAHIVQSPVASRVSDGSAGDRIPGTWLGGNITNLVAQGLAAQPLDESATAWVVGAAFPAYTAPTTAGFLITRLNLLLDPTAVVVSLAGNTLPVTQGQWRTPGNTLEAASRPAAYFVAPSGEADAMLIGVGAPYFDPSIGFTDVGNSVWTGTGEIRKVSSDGTLDAAILDKPDVLSVYGTAYDIGNGVVPTGSDDTVGTFIRLAGVLCWDFRAETGGRVVNFPVDAREFTGITSNTFLPFRADDQ